MIAKALKPIIILVIFLLLTLRIYTYYIDDDVNLILPEEVQKSTATIDRVNHIRSSFKMSLLAHQSIVIYTTGVLKEDTALIQESLENIEAAIAFVSILGDDAEFNREIINKLNDMKDIIRSKGVDSDIDDVENVERLLDNIHVFSENKERGVWTDIQREYINFVYLEYKEIKTYQVISGLFLVVLAVFIYQMVKSSILYNKIKRKEHELEEIAFVDKLTGLPNRASLENELEKYVHRSISQNQNGTLALINVDDFKKINDTYGRNIGDELLKNISGKISDIIGKLGTISRIGGDEFAITFPIPSEYRETLKRIVRIYEYLRMPISVSGREFNITISVGLANTLGNASELSSWNELIKNANLALMKAKEDGKNCFHSYEQKMRDDIERDLELESEIKSGLASEQFELYYQPFFCIQSRKITTLEALVRWNHPEKGILTPNSFIKVIDNSYIAKEFCEWVICKSIEQQHLWKNQGIDISISLNLPLRLILDVDFVEKIKLLTSSLNANLNMLYFEISNYGIYQINPKIKVILRELSELGFKFYLDDFGADSSSISTIEELPISAVKIDMKHIRNISSNKQDNLVVDGIMSIAKSKGLEVIAEGVENKTQASYLNSVHCDYLQGYLISKPLPVRDITELLRKRFSTKQSK